MKAKIVANVSNPYKIIVSLSAWYGLALKFWLNKKKVKMTLNYLCDMGRIWIHKKIIILWDRAVSQIKYFMNINVFFSRSSLNFYYQKNYRKTFYLLHDIQENFLRNHIWEHLWAVLHCFQANGFFYLLSVDTPCFGIKINFNSLLSIIS